MKNSLSKVLICGVIASSFILVNCQKAPGRGVRGTKGAPTADATKGADATAPLNLVKCTDAFLSDYKDFAKLMESEETKKIRAVKQDERKTFGEKLTETQKADLKELNTKFIHQKERVLAELDKMQVAENKKAEEKKTAKKDLDGCALEDAKKTSYTRKSIAEFANNFAKIVSDIIGEEVEGAAEGRKEAEERKQKAIERESDVTNSEAQFFVSTAFNDSLEDSKIEDSHYVGGKIETGLDSLEKRKLDETVSVCWITSTTGKLSDETKSLRVLKTTTLDKVAKKSQHEINLGSGDSLYTMKCSVAKNKTLSQGFRDAISTLLKTKRQLEKDKKEEVKKEEVKKTTEVKKEEKKDTKVVAKKDEKKPVEKKDDAVVKTEEKKKQDEKNRKLVEDYFKKKAADEAKAKQVAAEEKAKKDAAEAKAKQEANDKTAKSEEDLEQERIDAEKAKAQQPQQSDTEKAAAAAAQAEMEELAKAGVQ